MLLVYEFVTLFVVLDPFGMLAIFLAVTPGLESAQRVKAAVLAILYAFGVLAFFIVVGELLLIQAPALIHADCVQAGHGPAASLDSEDRNHRVALGLIADL